MCTMARVILGVTGGIAAYKACELARLLVRAGHEVTPILTPEAEAFVTAKTFEALARRGGIVGIMAHPVGPTRRPGRTSRRCAPAVSISSAPRRETRPRARSESGG